MIFDRRVECGGIRELAIIPFAHLIPHSSQFRKIYFQYSTMVYSLSIFNIMDRFVQILLVLLIT